MTFDGTTGASSTDCLRGYFFRAFLKVPYGVPVYSTMWLPSITP
jgi:hypothetical protein